MHSIRSTPALCHLAIAVLCSLGTGSAGGQEPRTPKSQPVVLKLLLKKTPQPNYGAQAPAQISGQVLLRDGRKTTGAEGVSVTDGYSVTKTDATGRYTIKPNPHGVFIALTRPSGFEIHGDWYKPLASRVDFELTASKESEDEFLFVHVTDTHVSKSIRSLEGLSRFVREVNALKPRPRFVINSGDLLNLSKSLTSSPESGRRDFRSYVGIMNHLSMPYYNVAGDHTDSSHRIDQFPRGDIRCGKPLFWEFLGPHFFSFEYGRIHFVSVDFGYHLGQRQIPINGKLLEYPTNQVQPPHINWLKQDMAQRTPGTFVVTSSEADLENHCPGFTDIAKAHDVRLQLVGDNHVVAHKATAVPWRSGGALAGCWWNPKTNRLCPDLSPQGYLIYRVQGEKLDQFYKGLGQRVAIVSHRIGAPLQGRVAIHAHLVQPDRNESLEYSLNGEDWIAMREVSRPFLRAEYQATVDTASLPDGLLTFHVRSTTGEVRTREFAVANRRDLASVKTDGVLHFAVGSPTSWTKPQAPDSATQVLFNGEVVGTLDAKARKMYSLKVPASLIRKANLLSFRFAGADDGMTLSSPVLALGETELHDLRDVALRRIKTAHWGSEAAEWGGYIAGSPPSVESPFHRKQNVFCFVLEHAVH